MRQATVEQQLAALKNMTPQRLRQRYAELYGEPSRSGKRLFAAKLSDSHPRDPVRVNNVDWKGVPRC